MRRRIPVAFAVAVLFTLIAGFAAWVYFGDTVFKQTRRMEVGREFLPQITNVLYAHPEFRDVQVGVGYAKTGCFLISGSLGTQVQLSKLREVIAAAEPPLDVVYRLTVFEDYSAEPSTEPGDRQ
ncbi:MAG: hypothetical protein H7A46_22935 [Verrucomicrobiales bacterium]|nr:hypothetical protein [Verrucomicrobiales bacterium]